MTATIDPIVSPDPATMRDFLEHLFGGYLDGYHSGLVELAYKDGERWGAVTFGTDQLDELVEEACRLNSVPGINVYVGAWLRRETAANRRASDPDAWAMTCAYVDLDTEGAAAAAKQVYGQLKPSWITVTGSFPHTRAQMWWRLAEPITDHHRGRELLTVMGRAMKGDPTIVNPSRVMRLAGSVAWPTKDGRRVEPTRRGTLKEAGAKVYAAESLERSFAVHMALTTPIFETKGDSPRDVQGVKPDQTLAAAGTLGLPLVLTDGREEYMRDTTLALLIEYMGENGTTPSAEELCEYVWPQYSAGVDFSRPGRGKPELLQKCRSTLRRFEEGRLTGLPDIDAAIARYQAKQPAKTVFNAPATQGLGNRFKWVIPPPREWIYGRHYIRKFISSTVAPGGVGKSSLTIAETLAMVTGKPILGVPVDEKVNVWMWNGEDPMDELQRRIIATATHYGIGPEELDGLFVDSGRDSPVIIAAKTREGVVINMPLKDEIIAFIKANGIGVMVVDPFVSSHRLTENDNGEMEQVAQAWAEIAEATNCSIELVHHVRKTMPGMAVGVEDGRGAGSVLAKARAARAINRMTADEGARAGVEDHKYFFRTDDGKANLAPPAEGSTWYQMVPVDLGNGTGFRPSDSIGVVTRWTWPDAFEGVTAGDLEAVLHAMGDEAYRVSPQSKDGAWIGNLIMRVLDLDPAKPSSVAKAKCLQKVWTENGALKEFHQKKPNGASTPLVKRAL